MLTEQNPPLNVRKILLSNKKKEHFQRNGDFSRISTGHLFLKAMQYAMQMAMNYQCLSKS